MERKGCKYGRRCCADTAKIVNATDNVTDTAKILDNGIGATSTNLYALGNASVPRDPRIEGYNFKPGQQPDIYIDANGLVIPGQGGASTFETIEQLNSQGLSGYVWELPKGSATPGFDVIPDGIPFGSQPPGHHSLVPNFPVSPATVIDRFNQLPWKQGYGQNGKPLKLPTPQ